MVQSVVQWAYQRSISTGDEIVEGTVACCDIDDAFLVPEVLAGEPLVHIKVSRQLASLMLEDHPAWAEYVDAQGSIVYELGRHLSGLPHGAPFDNHLHASLAALGFRALTGDWS